MSRGEMLENDEVVLVGHSTGGLDIRQLICDLHNHERKYVPADGGEGVTCREIRERLKAVVFLSVPHWGTNVADWVYSHPAWRMMVLTELRAVIAGSRVYPLDQIEAGLT